MADDLPGRAHRVRVRDARGARHPGRRGDHRLRGDLGRHVLRARRAPRPARLADRGDRRDRRDPPGRAAQGGRPRDRGHRPVASGDRSVRRGGPAGARGARLARLGRLRERQPAAEGARGRQDRVGAPGSLAGAQRRRERLQRAGTRRRRRAVDHRRVGRRRLPARPQERGLRPGASSRAPRRPVARRDPRRAREPLPRLPGGALRDRTRRGRTGAEGVLADRRARGRADRPDELGAGRVRGAGRGGAARGRHLLRTRPRPGTGDRADRLARARERAARERARAVPRARRDARRDLLGGRAEDPHLHVPVQACIPRPRAGDRRPRRRCRSGGATTSCRTTARR